MAAQSARLKDTPRPVFAETQDDEFDDNASDAHQYMDMDVDSEPEKPKKKRAPAKSRSTKKRKATEEPPHASGSGTGPQPVKRVRGTRGLLKALVEMPMDILFEIFGHLLPYDLLSLARTTKTLRGILMSKSSLSLWKEASSNVPHNMPPCPEDLTEPMYAELAFGKHCFMCQRNVVSNHLSWGLKLRACTKCIESSMLFSTGCYRVGFQDLMNSFPTITVLKGSARRWSSRRRQYFHLKSIDAWHEEYTALPTDKKDLWLEQKRAELQKLAKEVSACEQWATRYQEGKESEKADVVIQRKAIVLQRLKELGWQEELDKIPNGHNRPEDLPFVQKACQKDITERVLENMKDPLVEAMEHIKAQRIMRERKEFLQERITNFRKIYTDYLVTLPAEVFYPYTVEMALDPVIKDIVDNSESSTFSDDEIGAMVSIFPEAFVRWRKTIENKLAGHVHELLGPNTDLAGCRAVLFMARATFTCSHCRENMTTEQAIAHSCARKRYNSSDQTDPDMKALVDTLDEVPWTARKDIITFSVPNSELVGRALEGCELDPNITAQELEELDPVFECLQCNNVQTGRQVIRWGMLAHHLNSCRNGMIIQISEAEASKVRERMQEEGEIKLMAHSYQEYGMCLHCRKKGKTPFTYHMKEDHGIHDPELGIDHIRSPEVRPLCYISRLWPPRRKADLEDAIAKFTQRKTAIKPQPKPGPSSSSGVDGCSVT